MIDSWLFVPVTDERFGSISATRNQEKPAEDILPPAFCQLTLPTNTSLMQQYYQKLATAPLFQPYALTIV